MSHIGPIIAASGNLSIMSAERLVAGIKPESFARLARPGGVTIQSNHPAWVFGHLALYPVRVLAALDRPVGPGAYPPKYEALFKNGVECLDDADGGIYPSMAELTGHFFESYKAAVAAIRSAPDEAFVRPNPAEGRMRELFPTIGAALNFYVGSHVQNHLGQVSAWRRAVGMPAA